MNDLIKIANVVISGETLPMVNTQELHEFLERDLRIAKEAKDALDVELAEMDIKIMKLLRSDIEKLRPAESLGMIQLISDICTYVNEGGKDSYDKALTMLQLLKDKEILPPEIHEALFMFYQLKRMDDFHTSHLNKKLSTEYGHVYIVEYESGNIKIGMSVTPIERMNALSHQSPERQKRHWISDNIKIYRKLEKHLHKLYKEHRLHGEFFKVKFDIAVLEAKMLIKDPLDLED